MIAEGGNTGVKSGELILWAAIWFALVAAVPEVVVLTWKTLVAGQVINRTIHYLWLSPLGYLALFAVPAGLMFGIAKWKPTIVRPRAVVGVFAFGAAMAEGVTWLYGRVHPAALLVLAAGVGVQAAALVDRRPRGFVRFARRSATAALAVFGLVAAGIAVTRTWQRSQELAGLPDPPPGAPSVLLIILDTVRAANMSLYGYHRPNTPALERLARDAVVFDRAIAPSSWTLPSHASMFTGRRARDLNADWVVPLDETEPTLAEMLRDQGFATGGFVANRRYTTAEHGIARGFARYRDHQLTAGEVLRSAGLFRWLEQRRSFRPPIGTDHPVGRKLATTVNDEFLRWLDGVGDRPFFAFLNYYDAHDPYLPPSPWKEQFAGDRPPTRLSPYYRIPNNTLLTGGVPPAVAAEEMAAYDGAIAYLDHAMDELFEALRDRERWDNTVVIITSDHGELFGEHDLFLHGRSLYAPELVVPLIIAFPPRTAGGARVTETVSLVNTAATALDLVGLSGLLPGTSLVPTWAPDTSAVAQPAFSSIRQAIRMPDHTPGARGDMMSVAFEGWHYIRHTDGTEELYDWTTDPDELHNLARDDRAADQLDRGRELVGPVGPTPARPMSDRRTRD